MSEQRVTQYFLERLIEGRTKYVDGDVEDVLIDLRNCRADLAATQAALAEALSANAAAEQRGMDRANEAIVKLLVEVEAAVAETRRALRPGEHDGDAGQGASGVAS